MGKYLLGIDSGTSTCKSVLFDLEGRIIAKSSPEHEIEHPQPTWAEQDADFWWSSVVGTVKNVIKQSKMSSEEIIGVGADSQRE